MKSSEVKHAVEQMIYLMSNVENHMKSLTEQLSLTDQELTDIQHECELSKLNACEMAKAWMKQKEVLRRRRAIKDEKELLGKFTAFASSDQQFKQKLSSMMARMNELIGNHKKRKYTPRVRTDLKLCQCKNGGE